MNKNTTDSSKKETLLVLASTFPRWKNDNEPRFIYDLCLRLKEKYNIILLTSHFENTKQIDKLDGLTIHRYRYAPDKLEKLVYNGGITTNLKSSPWKWLLVPPFLIAQFLSLIKLLKLYPIKLIHAHWIIPQGVIALLALKSTKSFSIPLLCTSHGGDLFGLQDRFSKKVKKWVMKNSQSITVVSKSMFHYATTISPESINKLHIIPMGTDFKNQFKINLDIHRKENQLLFAGRLVEKKGVATLIKAMAKVLDQFPETKLTIAGDGPEKTSLMQLATDINLKRAIHFIGQQDHQSLSVLYSTATISVFPFQKAKNGDIEGLGLVLLEAMGCGCPVIAGDVPAIHDVIQNNKTGIISEQRNSNMLADKIISLLSCPTKREELAQNGRIHAVNNFSWEISGKRYIEVVESLISKKL